MKQRMTMADLRARGKPRFTSTGGFLFDDEPAEQITMPDEAPRRESLFSITGDIAELIRDYDDALEDGDEERAEAIGAALEQRGEAFDEKADAYVWVASEAQALAKAIRDEEKRLAELRHRHERRQERVLRSLEAAMRSLGLRSAGKIRSAKLVGNGGKAPLVVADDLDPKTLPQEFQRVRVELDKDAVRDAILHGVDVPGCSIGERGESLRWK